MNIRKLTGVALVALFAAGCSFDDNIQNRQLAEQELTITATREEDEVLTRTYRDDADGSIWWIPGDAISLFYGSGTNGGSKFTSVNTTDTTKVTNFTGVITAITGGGEIAVDQTYFWGLYPYQEDASCDGASVTMTLPKEQTAVPGTFATNTFPSIGRSQGLIMGFYNICSGMKFSVTKEGIKKVTLKSRNGEHITGKAKVSFEDGIPVAEIIDGSDEVVLEAPAGEYFEPGKYYFLVFFPTKFTNGFTVTFETFTEEAVYERTGSMTANRSRFGTISNIDANLTYSQKTGNIPIEDANFKSYLVQNFDSNGDGEISYEEASSITSIAVNTNSIGSLQGIEFMQNMASLSCIGFSANGGQLTSIDISNNTALTYLQCSDNQLTTIDISKNTALTQLLCYNNQLKSLEVSMNTALTQLLCNNNQLTSLDVSRNTALTSLNCNYNQLTSLDVSMNTALTDLRCSSNQLVSLDVSMNTALAGLSCFSNQLTSLDVSKNTALTDLDCSNNQLTSLDVSMNTELTELYCSYNQLPLLDVSNNTELTDLRCNNSQLTNLDVSNNTALTHLHCYNNRLTFLDLTSNTNLRYLRCHTNRLTSLDVSKNTMLVYLECYYNQLATLDVSKNTELTHLKCYDNQLISLDISNNTALKQLLCYTNQFRSLDVSKNTALTFLRCSPMDDSNGNNLLTTLYISQGQWIPSVTTDRSDSCIPAETQIVVVSDGDDSGFEYVDLGLPSGIKWANADISGYYAWGETTTKSRYYWTTYKWGDGQDFNPDSGTHPLFSKYNTATDYGNVDNLITLEPEDDAAHAALGGKWRMPTYDDCVELIQNCDWEWTETGIIVTSRINGNSIRLALASGNYGMDPASYADGFARYWTSSLDADNPYRAWRLTVRPDNEGENVFLAPDDRAAGLAIRPVYVQ